MTPGLLLVDLQRDFLARAGLAPGDIVERTAALLDGFRARGGDVFHAHTVVRDDERMPHWQRDGVHACLEGTPGAEPALPPRAGEPVFCKRFYSAFGDPALDGALRARGVDTLVVAGLYLHGCIRATVLDAYERGYEVLVAADAVGSTEPEHAAITRDYLDGRAATFLDTAAVLGRVRPRTAPATAKTPAWDRAPALEAFAARLGGLEQLLRDEIGKAEAAEEVERAVAHVRTAVRLFGGEQETRLDGGVRVRYRPRGVVGIITPWNNPLAIPAGKLAPALLLGNRVVWKPAQQVPRTSAAILHALHESGVPAGVVEMVEGGADAARRVIERVDAVSLTGSLRTGRDAAQRCARLGKPFQGELGGNNAAVVLADCDVETHAPAMAHAAFSFRGQRCTSIQRFIVERGILDRFERAFVAAARDDALAGGLDLPLVRNAGARVACEAPVVLADVPPDAAILREEVFGPVALILPADDLDDAIAIANGVEQGLLAALYSNDPAARQRFADAVEAGIVTLAPGPLRLHPEAPFLGWKASGVGPPEHGLWDREFYARPQVVYGC